MKNFALLLSVLSISAFAQTGNTNQQGPQGHGNRSEMSTEMKAAFEACKSSGKPGETAFDSCMESKGFKNQQVLHHKVENHQEIVQVPLAQTKITLSCANEEVRLA